MLRLPTGSLFFWRPRLEPVSFTGCVSGNSASLSNLNPTSLNHRAQPGSGHLDLGMNPGENLGNYLVSFL
jgi:hypothetical protein